MMHRTKLTKKSQTTMPKPIRERLGVGPGDTVEWYVLQDRGVVDARAKVRRPADILLGGKAKRAADAVNLVRKEREDLS